MDDRTPIFYLFIRIHSQYKPFTCLIQNCQIIDKGMAIFGLLIAVQNPTTKKTHIVQREYQLDSVSWKDRNEVKNSFKFLARESLQCLEKSTRHSVKHDNRICFIQASNRPVAAFAFTDDQYPPRVIFAFLRKALDIFFESVGEKWKEFEEDMNLGIKQIQKLFKQYQNPAKVDKMSEALQEAEKTNLVLHNNMNGLLQRRGDLDKLIEESKDLSEAAKNFYKETNKLDQRCCQLI